MIRLCTFLDVFGMLIGFGCMCVVRVCMCGIRLFAFLCLVFVFMVLILPTIFLVLFLALCDFRAISLLS